MRNVTELRGAARGKMVAVVCTGPSLAEVDLRRLEHPDVVTVAVNDAIFHLTRPDYHIVVDGPKLNGRYLPGAFDQQNLLWQQGECSRSDTWQYPENTRLIQQEGHAEDMDRHFPGRVYAFANTSIGHAHKRPEALWYNSTTAEAALCLARFMDPIEVWLLGFDCYRVGEKKYPYWVGFDPRGKRVAAGVPPEWRTEMDELAKIFDSIGWSRNHVKNLSPHCTCNAWPKDDPERVLPRMPNEEAIYTQLYTTAGYGCGLNVERRAKQHLKWLEEVLPPESGPRVLDFACGNGQLLEALAEAGYKKLCGTEFSYELAARFSHRPFSVIRVTAAELAGFDDGAHHAVIANDFLEHLPTIKAADDALRQLARIGRWVSVSMGLGSSRSGPWSKKVPDIELHAIRQRPEWWRAFVARHIDIKQELPFSSPHGRISLFLAGEARR